MPIMIVDDNEQNLKLARVALECEGFEVQTATNGEAAIELLSTIHPRLILMDLQLPGLDGLEVARRVKADLATRDILIVAVTAYAMKGDREKAMNAGCDGYITKPLDPILLPGQIGEYLGTLPPRGTKVIELQPRDSSTEVPPSLSDDRALILVIEDNPTTRKMFRISLESAGHRVVEVQDGATALAFIEHGTPALIVQDLNLPDMDGLDLARCLRERLGDTVPIVCVSGFLSRLDEARAVEGGFVEVLVKPIDPQRLLDITKLHLTTFHQVDTRIGQARHVLVVDDDPLQQKLSQIWLENAGFEVSVAADGEVGLEMARENPPSVVVADVLMPKLDGFGLCLKLRSISELAHIPVVLSSAEYVERPDRDLATRVGASALIAKADGPEAVMTAVCAALEVSPPPPPTEATELLEDEHARRGSWQLERQLRENTRLRSRSAQQEAQLAVLAGVADSLAKNQLDSAVLGDALASCLDMAGISKGALYIAEPDGHLVLQHQIGYATTEVARLRVAFGHESMLRELTMRGQVVLIPSERVPTELAERLLTEAGTTALLVVPVARATQIFGAMILGARLEDVSGEDALAFARVLGAQMGQAIGLSRSFASLAASEQRYRTLTEHANDAIVILSLDGVIRESNPRFTEILGYSIAELVGRHIGDLAATGREQESIQKFKAQVLAESGRSPPIELQRKDGTTAIMEFSNATVNIGGEPLVLTIGRDVTEQVRAQAHLMTSDRMASVGMLAAGVAHEINNPLAAVLAYLDFAVEDTSVLVSTLGQPRFAELQESLHAARDAADRVRQIVKDLKIFSRAEENRCGAVDTQRVLESTVRMAANEIRHRAHLAKNYGMVPLVEANESRLGQVFLNLVVNAAQAIPEGRADHNEIRITTSLDTSGMVLVEIGDTGPGIPPETLKNLFTPFFTTKAAGVGTGLGLAICKRIVTELGGRVTVESTVGIGTTFKVYLPCARSEIAAVAPTIPSGPPTRRGKVLLVDDDAMLGQAVGRSLVALHDVRIMSSAQEALDCIVGGQRFDVILCDMMMPILTGMDFYEKLYESVREQAERIVFLTGGAFTIGAREFLDRVPNVRMEKPFDVKNLRAFVNARVLHPSA